METLWLSSAYFAGLLANRLGLPPLVGYLIAGYALNLAGVRTDEGLSHLSEIGILLLLFTVGLKLKIRDLFKREVAGVGALHLLAVGGFSGLLFFLDGLKITGGLLLGTSLAFSSTVLAMKVLEDNRELGSFHGRTVMGILIFQDVIAVVLLGLAGVQEPSPVALGLLLLPLLSPVANWLFSHTRNSELRLLLGVLMAFAGGKLATNVGISEDLGALLMGLLLANHPGATELARKLWGLKEVLLVAFFLQIGLLGAPDVEQLLRGLSLLTWLPIQGWLFFSLFLLMGLRAHTGFVGALALMTYSEFALIVSMPAIESGLLDAEWKPILGFTVACSLAIAALLNRNSHRLYTFLEPVLIRFERVVPHPDKLPAHLGHAEWLIVGMGRTGRAAYEVMDRGRHKVFGLDADPVRIQLLQQEGYRVAYGDGEDHGLWAYGSLQKLQGVILALPDFAARRLALKHLREKGFQGTVGTLSFSVQEDPTLYRLGADVVFHPFTEAGEKLAERMLEAIEETPEPTLPIELGNTPPNSVAS